MSEFANLAPALEVRGLSVRLAGRLVVDDASFTVTRGSWTSIIGPNGSGKSSMLRAIAGVIDSTGSIELNGTPMAGLDGRQAARSISLVPQSPIVPPQVSVADYVLLGRNPHVGRFGRESAHDRQATSWAIDRLGLGDLATRAVERLSGGERQRAVIARSLAQEARIMLLDEPTSALDVGHVAELLDLLDELRSSCDLTVVTTMHDLTVAARGADQMVALLHGRIVACGSPSEVLTESTLSKLYGRNIRVIDVDGSPVVLPFAR
jgi:iron complex transport system ATP-binding protein